MTEAALLAGLRQVRLGSLNPPKLAALRAALAAFAPQARVEGFAAESGVSDQPVGYEEIVAGATNRAVAAHASGPCDLGVGYEDGLVRIPGADGVWFNVGCAVLTDGSRRGYGLSSGFAYPPACADAAAELQDPIGERFDALWKQRRDRAPEPPSALSVGNVGRLTAGALPRAEYTRHAILCALARFVQADLYEEEPA